MDADLRRSSDRHALYPIRLVSPPQTSGDVCVSFQIKLNTTSMTELTLGFKREATLTTNNSDVTYKTTVGTISSMWEHVTVPMYNAYEGGSLVISADGSDGRISIDKIAITPGKDNCLQQGKFTLILFLIQCIYGTLSVCVYFNNTKTLT